MVTVDPAVLDAAGTATIAASRAFGSALHGELNALSASVGMTGTDPAGVVVGEKYDDAASAVVVSSVDTINGVSRVGDLLRTSAYNYATANHYSSITPNGGPPTKPTPTRPISAHLPPKAEGSTSQAPFGWGLIQRLIGMVWPNGDPAKMRAAAASWSLLGAAASTFDTSLVGPETRAHGEDIPEKPSVSQGFTDSANASAGIQRAASGIASQLTAYAQHVDDAHAHLKALISDAMQIATPSGFLDEAWSIVSGDEDKLKRIAREAEQVLRDLKVEADAAGKLLEPIIADVEAFAKVMAHWAAAELEDIGDDIENVAAAVVNATASYGNAMLHHPGDTAGLIGGGALMALGAGVELPGVALDATGVGALLGVPVNVAGGAMMLSGGAIAGASALDLSQAAIGDNGVTIMHAQTRDALGKYQGWDKESYDKEGQGIEQYAARRPNRIVVRNNRQVKFRGKDFKGENIEPVKPDGSSRIRKYDGYDMPVDPKPGPDGYVEVTGVEVKSGAGTPSANQKEFDPAVSAETPAYGTAILPDGTVIPVKVTNVAKEWVP
ncbi:hypothetical protein ACPXB3_14575 [Gordonia sp. DT219]|uniref:hypothetical protein n=1 Tax=Gordonia sp. DT219 TaxID=3416658 RepID=UPI003CE7FA3D